MKKYLENSAVQTLGQDIEHLIKQAIDHEDMTAVEVLGVLEMVKDGVVRGMNKIEFSDLN